MSHYYSTVTSFHLIKKTEHVKYASLLHSHHSLLSYYTFVSRFEDIEATIKGISVEQ